jgi:nucleotide-binding universal stress UspA family protein
MKTLELPVTLPEHGVRASSTAPVIVASDGRDQSDAALVVGGMLAEAPEALRVVTVVKTMPVVSPEAPIEFSSDVEAARRAEAKRAVLEQVHRKWRDGQEVEVYDGDPATVVTRIAHQSKATMIVCGLGRHRVMDRVFGDETALRLIRMSDVPVLAAASGLAAAPLRIVVAVDFSETSLRAARLALDLAAPGATIYLTHTAPRDSSTPDWHEGTSSYKHDAGAALEKTHEELRAPDGMRVQRVILQGEPATELLAFAASVNADLIATGSHGHGFVARLLVGSVTTRIVRCSTCSVLTVPHAAVMTQVRTIVGHPIVMTYPRPDWTAALDDFTRRNLGRRGTLEVDDPEIGAQAQEIDYPLLGATYDEHDARVELMLGELGDRTRHLTRGIGGVTAIDILRHDDGRDAALRVGHGRGQTLLTFSR